MIKRIDIIMQLLNQVKEEAKLEDDPAQKASFLIRIANMLNDLGEKETVKDTLLEALRTIENIEIPEDKAELLLETYDNFLTFGFILESEKALKMFLETIKGVSEQERKIRLYETLLTILLENNLVKKMKEISTFILKELEIIEIPTFDSPELTINLLRKLSIVVDAEHIEAILRDLIKQSDAIEDEDIRVFFLINTGSLAYQLSLFKIVTQVFEKLDYVDDKLDFIAELSDQFLEEIEEGYSEFYD